MVHEFLYFPIIFPITKLAEITYSLVIANVIVI